jgi:hypothetical protein
MLKIKKVHHKLNKTKISEHTPIEQMNTYQLKLKNQLNSLDITIAAKLQLGSTLIKTLNNHKNMIKKNHQHTQSN